MCLVSRDRLTLYKLGWMMLNQSSWTLWNLSWILSSSLLTEANYTYCFRTAKGKAHNQRHQLSLATLHLQGLQVHLCLLFCPSLKFPLPSCATDSLSELETDIKVFKDSLLKILDEDELIEELCLTKWTDPRVLLVTHNTPPRMSSVEYPKRCKRQQIIPKPY